MWQGVFLLVRLWRGNTGAVIHIITREHMQHTRHTINNTHTIHIKNKVNNSMLRSVSTFV